MQRNSDYVGLRYVYIIEADNRGRKSKYFGLKNIYYPGQTFNIIERFKQHLKGINSKFLHYNFPDSRKILVFVDYVYGNEYDSISEENKIKRMNRSQKEKLIKGERNKLIKYIPLKAIILKKYHKEDEQVCLYF